MSEVQSVTVERIDGWRRADWPPDLPPRVGYLVACSECGDLGKGWRYATSGVACSVATKHRNKHRRELTS